jgi:hypothetical protein
MDRQKLDKAFHASELIVKYLRSSPEEDGIRELDSWTEESKENRVLFSELTDPFYLNKQLVEFYKINANKKAALRKIRRQIKNIIHKPKTKEMLHGCKRAPLRYPN